MLAASKPASRSFTSPLSLSGEGGRGGEVLCLLLALTLPGCVSDWGSLRAMALREASVDAPDAVLPDVAPDAVLPDVAPPDVALPDATLPDVTVDVAPDAPLDVQPEAAPTGRCSPTVDGMLGTDWTNEALLEANTVPTAWTSNELRRVRVCFDSAALYLGIEGTSEDMNVIAAFVDRDEGAGTGITAGSQLLDTTGTLDRAISSQFAAFPTGFGADFVWGTRGMVGNRGGTNDAVGLRDVRTNPRDYGWLTGDTTACNRAVTTCEVSLPWSALYPAASFPSGRPANARLALFLRLGNGDGSMASNQTLPQDDPTRPFVVSRLLRFTVP